MTQAAMAVGAFTAIGSRRSDKPDLTAGTATVVTPVGLHGAIINWCNRDLATLTFYDLRGSHVNCIAGRLLLWNGLGPTRRLSGKIGRPPTIRRGLAALSDTGLNINCLISAESRRRINRHSLIRIADRRVLRRPATTTPATTFGVRYTSH
jgi:hypothetical protein